MVVDLAGWEVNHTPVGRLVDFGNIICIEFRVKNFFLLLTFFPKKFKMPR